MLPRSQFLKAISNLSFVKILRCNINKKFSSNTSSSNNNDNSSKDLEETPVSKLLDEAATFSEINNTEWATTPYPKTGIPNLDEKPTKPRIDPSETSVILFPGQGVIKVGDVKKYMKFPRVKELFQIANEILGYDLLKICLKGPQNLLDRTEFNQPATVVMSLAALEKLQEERPRAIESCMAVAGYSVGELTALIFSGALAYEEGMQLVGVRAAAMQNASEISPQGMLSCYCSPLAKTAKICEDARKWALDIGASDPVCQIAIYLYTQGKVFGGSHEALQYIEKNSTKLGLRKLQRLPVSGAFHTILMKPALKPFIKALDKISMNEPNALVYSNYSSDIYPNNEHIIRKYLTKQIFSPVKWEQIMHKIYKRPEGENFPRTFDMGSRGTMKTILKNVNAKADDSCYIY